MEFSKQFIDDQMKQYLQDNEDFGNSDEEETYLINEVFNGFKSLLLENTSDRVSEKLLQEHSNGLEGVPKDIFEDFVLYLRLTDLESQLL
jgi:hypothetical protein